MSELLSGVMKRASADPKAVAMASAVFRTLPFIGDRFVGSDSPNYLRARWRRAATDPFYIPWVAFAADLEAGPTPRDWPRIGILAIERSLLGKEQEIHPGARLAAAYVLGRTLMVAPLPKDLPFGEIDDDYCGIGVRVGPGPEELLAGAGLLLPRSRSFLPLHDMARLTGESILTTELETAHPDLRFV